MTDQPDHPECVQFDLHGVRFRFRYDPNAGGTNGYRLAIAAAGEPIDEAREVVVTNPLALAAGLQTVRTFIDAMYWRRSS
jgi:hypothetical protein